MRLALLFVLLAGCDAGTSFTRSCGGEPVLECDPYEWAVVEEASFEPAEVTIGDPRIRPHVRVTLSTCGERTPVAPTVQIQALLGRTDGGAPTRIVELATVSASSPTSTGIDVMIDNPFTVAGGLPPDTNVTLRFVPVVGGCDGDALEIPYRTGEVVAP